MRDNAPDANTLTARLLQQAPGGWAKQPYGMSTCLLTRAHPPSKSCTTTYWTLRRGDKKRTQTVDLCSSLWQDQQ